MDGSFSEIEKPFLLRLLGPTPSMYTLGWKYRSFLEAREETLEPIAFEGGAGASARTSTSLLREVSSDNFVRGSNEQMPFLPAGFDVREGPPPEISEAEKGLRRELDKLLKGGDEEWFVKKLEEREEQERAKADIFKLGLNEAGFVEGFVPDEERMKEMDKERASVGLEQGSAYAMGSGNGRGYVQVAIKQTGFSLASVFDEENTEDLDLFGFGDEDSEEEADEAEGKAGGELKENENGVGKPQIGNNAISDPSSTDDLDFELDKLLGADAFWGSSDKMKSRWRYRSKGGKDISEDDAWAIIDSLDISDFPALVPNPAIDYPFDLDPFQKRAVAHLERNESVFVAAHTSAGKTVVAEYAIALAFRHKTKVVYTSPIKTLSNQKFRDFSDRFGDVGIITGDISINPDASCLVMTTEILRSMLYKGADLLRDIEWVIFDELHYLNDYERGVVWEETIILLPPHIGLVMLSATVPNAMEFSSWVGRTKKRMIYVISTVKRPVPLMHSLIVNNELFPLMHSSKRAFQSLSYGAAKSKNNEESSRKNVSAGSRFHSWPRLIKFIRKHKLDPAVIFCFSKRKCEEAADSLRTVDLAPGAAEKSQIHSFFQSAVSRLSQADQEVPQIGRHRDMVKRGIGVHHSGILPLVKEITEVLFQRGLIRILFATETFAMGVNMPARTVVFSAIRKYDSRGRRLLEPGEYIQMAGRAGRRGLDSVGTVLLYFSPADFPTEHELKTVLTGAPRNLCSQFRLTYNSILNLLRTASLRVEDVMTRSFLEAPAQRDTKKTRRLIKSGQEMLATIQRESPHLDHFRDYHALLTRARVLAAVLFDSDAIKNHKTSFLPGRILVTVRSDGALCISAVISRASSRPKLTLSWEQAPRSRSSALIKVVSLLGGPAVQSLASPYLLEPKPAALEGHEVHELAGVALAIGELSSRDILTLTRTRIELSERGLSPIRGAPTTESLARVADEFITVARRTEDSETGGFEALHPLHDMNIGDIDLQEAHLELIQLSASLTAMLETNASFAGEDMKRALETITKESALRNRLSKIEAATSEESLQYMPDYQRRLAVLQQLGYLSSPIPSSVLLKGRAACEINTCESLIVTEMVFENHLQSLTASELVALLSCLVHQQKSDVSASEELDFIRTVSEPLFIACQSLERVVSGIAGAQAEHRLPVAVSEYIEGSVKWGMVAAVKAWAEGETFVEVCRLVPDISEGTIVRCIVRLCELVREVKNLARVIGNSELMEKAEEGILRCKRDVIFAASLYIQ